MTYDNLIELWREEVGVTEDDDLFTENDIVRLLGRAASEIAAALRFPITNDATATASIGDSSFSVPSTVLDIEDRSVQINGITLDPVDWPTIAFMRTLPNSYTARYYHYDRDRAGNVYFAPPTAVALGAGDIEYTALEDPEETAATDPGAVTTAADEPWGGAYEEWHYVIPVRAGVFTFEALELYQRAQYFDQRSLVEIGKMAASLFRVDLAQQIIPMLRRYESRAQSGAERSPQEGGRLITQ